MLTQAGIVPSGAEEGGGGNRKRRMHAYCKHIHALTESPRLRHPPSLFFTPRLSVWADPISHPNARTPSIPQASVRKKVARGSGAKRRLNHDRPGQARETKHTAALLFFCVNADGAEGKSATHAPLLTVCLSVCGSVPVW